METFWLCYGSYQGKRDVRLFDLYLQANFRKQKRSVLYETYVTDCLKNADDILANIHGGSVMRKRYIEVVGDMDNSHEETRSGEEIIEDIGNKLDMIGAS